MLTDSHCHLASHQFPTGEIPDIIARGQAAGVGSMITLSTCLENIQQNLTAADHPEVHACVGIHPCDVHHAPDDANLRLAEFTGDPRVCGIGETGLDYYHLAPEGWDEKKFRERQCVFLHRHFELAAAAKLNVVIHTRDREGFASFEDALAIYGDYHTSVRAVFHCFIGPWENAKRVLDLGGLVSFGGVATFKTAHQVRNTARQCPAGTFMMETDAPYLAPEPYRGKRNEPAYVRQTAERLAEVREESLDELTLHTNASAGGFFRFRSISHE
ncbi:MAG: TatD family hydrolase [Luteolibacter sp.]